MEPFELTAVRDANMSGGLPLGDRPAGSPAPAIPGHALPVMRLCPAGSAALAGIAVRHGTAPTFSRVTC